MQKFLTSLFTIITLGAYAQLKDTIFLNENSIKLTKEAYFSNEKNEHFFHFKTQKDSTTTILIKVAQRKYGRIDINTHNKIKKYLFFLSNKEIDSSKTIIINYFPKQDNCCIPNNPWSIASIKSFKRFVQKLKNKEHIYQFFIFKDTRTVNNFSGYFSWYADKESIIEKAFFKFQYPCYSYIIIKPNGNYFTFRGEYYAPEIIGFLSR
ncbi:hypothetical protein MHM83_13660 [Tenacibaculum sp. Mcav3-52]|uniref:hypothetical protein n=1 Tax=Tenacibaculum sp. Mcav3-52 TaxID=2917762 RepID=UPI001EF1CACA|nr:hypothetical protein [Tenacibaculum sp. Mcav3-52]MCG7502911.1 hypothetical protein [Tenacibaculum sp. Mcav3-52]BFF41581.1 hypothetical protein BACY1_33860 [Tenacibaculum mesophilum]